MRKSRVEYYKTDYWRKWYRERQERLFQDPVFRDKYRIWHRKSMRKLRLGTIINGKFVLVKVKNKRPRPSFCELCHKEKKVLGYHHWNNDNLAMGIWLCLRCHNFVEVIDSEGVEFLWKYLGKKEVIEEEIRALEEK